MIQRFSTSLPFRRGCLDLERAAIGSVLGGLGALAIKTPAQQEAATIAANTSQEIVVTTAPLTPPPQPGAGA